ncbi:MAG: Amidophosphoribosyltransferase, partial [Alphaproteobacteria bacterium MarineAlpha2_Bin1]
MIFKKDKFNEECGVFAIFNHNHASAHTALGLHALQHRGQEAAGIVTYENGKFFSEK